MSSFTAKKLSVYIDRAAEFAGLIAIQNDPETIIPYGEYRHYRSVAIKAFIARPDGSTNHSSNLGFIPAFSQVITGNPEFGFKPVNYALDSGSPPRTYESEKLGKRIVLVGSFGGVETFWLYELKNHPIDEVSKW